MGDIKNIAKEAIAKESIEAGTVEGVAGLEADKYKYGFETHIEMDTAPKGLNEDVIRLISKKKHEPKFLLEWRLKAFRHWQTMKMPNWSNLNIYPIDFQEIVYYAAPKKKKNLDSLDQVDEELLDTFDRLGIPLLEQKYHH